VLRPAATMTSTLGAELAGAQPLSTDKPRSRRQSYRSAACRWDAVRRRRCLDSGNSGCIGRMGQARAGVVADARRRGRHAGDHTCGALRTPAGTYPTGQ
jgi:hypothetical protein